MKNRVINLFAIIGVVTSIILACSSVLEETGVSSKNVTYDHLVFNNAMFIYNIENGDVKNLDVSDLNALPVDEWTVGLMSDNAGTPRGNYNIKSARGYFYILDVRTGEIYRTGNIRGENIFD